MYKQNGPGKAVDRRRHKRFRAREGALAFLGSVPGRIVDISRSGMSFLYVVFEKRAAQSLTLDIFFPADDFFLRDIPVFLVSDIDCPARTPFVSVQVKRLGVRFAELSAEQKVSLQHFLAHNTIAET